MTSLAGVDLRRPEYRRETFMRFYGFHLRHRSHPGCVYSLLPALADPDPECRAWVAFLNGNTQNPVTTSLLLEAAPTIEDADALVAFWREHYRDLAWDTDRRYHKARFRDAVDGYVVAVGRSQEAWWRRPQSWEALWAQLTALPTFGRLSAWSYAEYGWLLGLHEHDASTLMLEDLDGSRSHRNGLAIVSGHDELDWHASNPGFDGRYSRAQLGMLAEVGTELLAEARARTGHPDASNLTLESALCTYKSWHRPRRRYPNVYADMAYDRLRWAEARWGDRFGWAWEARARDLPEYLRLEAEPRDPGCVPAKQDHYRLTGETVMMGWEDPQLWSSFDSKVQAGSFGTRPS